MTTKGGNFLGQKLRAQEYKQLMTPVQQIAFYYLCSKFEMYLNIESEGNTQITVNRKS